VGLNRWCRQFPCAPVLFKERKTNFKRKRIWNGFQLTTDLPEKPGKKGYEHVYCLVYAPSEGALVRTWNCEHLCWDDEDGDDYSSLNGHITHWMPLPDKPSAQPTSEPLTGPVSSGLPCDFDSSNPEKVVPL
jgi:hypothetical protein